MCVFLLFKIFAGSFLRFSFRKASEVTFSRFCCSFLSDFNCSHPEVRFVEENNCSRGEHKGLVVKLCMLLSMAPEVQSADAFSPCSDAFA